MPLSAADYRELADAADQHVQDVAATAYLIADEQIAEASALYDQIAAADIDKAVREAARLKLVADLLELADEVEAGLVRSVAYVAVRDGTITKRFSHTGDWATLLGAVTSIANDIDAEGNNTPEA
ncbi:hypothetical protein BAJUN_02020 [Bajunvirus bajun]|uniref:Uncharacterized protein n=1 Tax=Brevundimonas phage vB_BgoS-Bajun TaxID=2948594 RepID=A0A9E7N7D6_9CAUD|nr:hypothetical protein BAJUN_02020 [Brevundimonas phage vB_BgoS-Bajun]